jgi:heme/copper-type cytochrome/quinol oxidase subunit 2
LRNEKIFLKTIRISMMNKKSAAALAMTILMFSNMVGALPDAFAQTGTVRNFNVATEYDLGGQGYDVFFPQTLVVEQNDQVNMTVRNVGTESFQLEIEDQPTVTIQPGTQNATGVAPKDTMVPAFAASTPGIFNFQTAEHPEMNGQLVVLPSDFSSYNPSTQTRNFTELVLPDFAGDGYDKFFPGVMVVNQGDTVNVSVRNTDDMPHGFAIAAYSLDVAVNPGQDLPNGTIAPFTTLVPPFVASTPGIFRFLCTTPCGPGHFEMVGALVVLPTQGSAYSPEPSTMYSYLTIKPDFAGDGYDKYVPGTIFVNQNDFVYIKVRNTDEMNHGFALPNFGINNETITGAQNTSSGLVPTDTYITAFFADQPGIYEFFCTIYCGPGHDQMFGYLVVLPTHNGTTTAPIPSGTTPLFMLLLLSIAILIVGILIGVIIVVKFDREKSKT